MVYCFTSVNMCKLPNKSMSAQFQASSASLGFVEDASTGPSSLGEVDSIMEVQEKMAFEDAKCNCDSFITTHRVDSMDKCKLSDQGYSTTPETEEKDDSQAHDSTEHDLEEHDHEDMDLENLIEQDWKGARPSAPLLRRQKRRQRQRANAKIGRAIRRFVQRRGHRQATYFQCLLEQAQRSIVGYLDYLFGPMNLPTDDYLNNTILEPLYKSARVSSILHFEGIQKTLAPLAPLEPDLQLAIVVDSLRWSQTLRCGPICYPNGEVVYFIRVKPQQTFVPMTSPNPPPAMVMPAYWICVCSNCAQPCDTRFNYCSCCGFVFS